MPNASAGALCRISLPFLLAGHALGQATLYMTPIGADITPDGNRLVGPLYDVATRQAGVHVLDRTDNTHARFSDRGLQDGSVYCNADATVLAGGMNDLENLAGFGPNLTLAHLHQGAGPWTNLGPAPGASACDFSINSAWGIARLSNEVAISGWTDHLCGPFRAWIYDPGTGEFTQLPASVSGPPLFQQSFGTRTNGISDDGSVVCGWDDNWNADFTTRLRKAVVWQRVDGRWTQTILDEGGGAATSVSGDGNVVIGSMSPATMLATFGTSTRYPVRWVRHGSSWTPQNLGGSGAYRAFWVSRDGAVIAGDSFVWKADLNGGVAVDLASYLSSRGLDLHGLEYGAVGGTTTQGLSGDGNSLMVLLTDRRDPCLVRYLRGVVDLNGRPCAPPVVLSDPASQSVVGALGDPAYDFYLGVILNVMSAGTSDMLYRWQKQTPSGLWADLTDDNCDQFRPQHFNVKAASGPQLRLGELDGPGSYAGTYRCVVSNGCGSVSSAPAIISPPCRADFNGDGFLDFFDYDDYVNCFESGECPPGKDADFNGDGFADFFDYDDFVSGFESGC